MKAIGQMAGVSQAAVSMIINGKARQANISADTAQRVLAIARQEGYRPNVLAQSMKTGRTGIVGVLVSEENLRQMSHGFGHNAVSMKLQAEFLLHNHRVMLEAVSERDWRECRMPELLSSRLADVLVICENFAESDETRQYLQMLHRQLPRIIVVDDTVQQPEISYISLDNIRAGRECADYLWRRGHRSFAAVACAEERMSLRLRLEGFRLRLAELAGAEVPVPLFCGNDRWQLECGGIAVERMLDAGSPLPTALLGLNDFFAYGAELELLRRGVKIPSDLSLLGIGEWPMAASAPVPITTYGLDGEEKLANVMNLLNEQLEGDFPQEHRHLLHGYWQERQSVSDFTDAATD